MDDYELASKLFGTTRTEAKSTSPSVSLIHGTAVENSSGGMVKVRIEGNVTGEDDILEVPTSPYVQAGDDVVIALSGSLGRSPMVMGNTGSGDTIYDDAARAREAADEINELLDGVEEMAEEAGKTVAQIMADGEAAGANAQAALAAAQAAQTAAATAGTAASQAYEFANGASMSLSEVERVVGTLNWISEHGTYTAATETSPVSGRIYYTRSGSGTDLDPYVYEMVESVPFTYALTEDQSIVSGKTYYTRSGSGTSADPYVYTPVETPDVSEISTYYERIPGNPYALGYYYLVVDESVQNYLASHLSQTAYGLDLMVDDSDFHMHIGTVNGQMAMGTYVIDANGLVVASFTADGVLVGESGSTHISIEDDGLYVFDDDDIIAAMQKRGNWAELFIGVDTGAGIDFDGEIMINDSSQDPPFGIWYYVTGSGKLKLYKSDGSGGFYKDGHVTREFVNEDMDTDPDPTHTDPRDYGYNIEKYDFYDNARSFKMRVLEKFLGSSSTPTGISDDSYITEQYGYYYEMAFFDEDLVEVSDDFYDAFLLYEPYIGLGGASYSTSDDKGLKFRYGSNGTVMMTDGEVMYPIITRETWSTSSSTSSLPFNPCFVYDSGHNVLWRCYDGISRQITPTLPLSVANGGTGANNAADARANLGALASGESVMTGSDLNSQPVGALWWGTNFSNSPDYNGWFNVIRFGEQQMAWQHTGNSSAPYVFVRSAVNSTWQPWVRLLDSSTAYLPLSGGTLTGNLVMSGGVLCASDGVISSGTSNDINHRLIMGIGGRDYWDFCDWGGDFRFYQAQNGAYTQVCRIAPGNTLTYKAVLFNGPATNGTVNLSASAANYNHMRIYFRKDSDSYAYGSVDVYSPNGNRFGGVLLNAYGSSWRQFLGRTYTISGTTIKAYNGVETWINVSTSGGTNFGSSGSSFVITRVEAWNE